MDQKKKLKYTLNIFLCLSVIFFLLVFLFPQVRFLKMITGGIYVLLLPGFILVSGFLRKKSQDFVEQSVLSFVLSISVICLVTFTLYLLVKVNFTLANVGLVAFFISSMGLFFWYRKVKKIVASRVS